MADPPTGTVTFLFTDIEGSTRLWAEHGEAMGRAVARHDELIRQVVEAQGGYVFSTAGDSFAAAFSTAHGAMAAAVEAQRGMAGEEWGEMPIRVRMGIHSGAAEERGSDYFGPVVNETARLMAAAHGGQLLASADTARVAAAALPDGVDLTDLGVVRLRDVDHPLAVVQLTHPDLGLEFPPLRGLAETPNNLPSQLTSFVGRDGELEEVSDLIGKSRLVTLTGAGGSGKTRLALQSAAALLDNYPDGVWFVDLAVVDDPALVPGVVASAAGVPEAPGRSIIDRLVANLEERDVLLVVDSCEHVLDKVGSLVVDVLKRTAAVQVLATSRQRLGVAGEQVYVVPVLAVPVERTTDPAGLGAFPAIRLFADRAETAHPDFCITQDNAVAVIRVCQRLDGLPLALELAAARLNIFDIRELERRIDDRFGVLTGGPRDQLARHQTLAATLGWSYQLLSGEEQRFFNRLSVFNGGCTLDAAEQVAAGDVVTADRALDLVSGLVEHSLLIAYQGVAGRRFRFLGTVGEYATARLRDSGEQADLEQRHADYFQRLAVDSYDQQWGPDEAEWLDRLDEEWPNLRRSLQWHFDSGRIEQGQLMSGSLPRVYDHGYRVTEGIAWLRRFVEADPSPSLGRARALFGLATLSEEARDALLWDEVIDLYREFASKKWLAHALLNASGAAMARGDVETARVRITEALVLVREVSDPMLNSQALAGAAFLALADDDPTGAVAFQEEGVQWARQCGSPEWLAEMLQMLGLARRYVGDLDGAEAALSEAHQDQWAWLTEAERASVALDRGDIPTALTHLLEYNEAVQPLIEQDSDQWNIEFKPLLQWARVAIGRGEYEIAVTLLGADETHRMDPHTEPSEWPFYLGEVEGILDTGKNQLDGDRYDAAWGRGLHMTSTEALEYAVDTLTTGSA